MSRRDRRVAGDRCPLVVVPEGMGDEPRMRLSQNTINYVADLPNGPNPYRCQDCGGWTVTVHLHPGVTPMFLSCGFGTGCGGQAVSAMYPDPALLPDLSTWPLLEWYRPSAEEFATLSAAKRDHIERGGLALRPREGTVAPAGQRAETDDEKRARLASVFGRPS